MYVRVIPPVRSPVIGIRQDRDDGAEPLAVEFVERLLRVGLPEIDPLAPAERVDVLERPLDRPMAHVDAADVAQVSLAWRASDGLQAGDDPAPRSFPCALGLRLPLGAVAPLAPFAP